MTEGAATEVAIPTSLELARRRPNAVKAMIRLARQKPLGAIGGMIVLGMVAVAIFAHWLVPYDPYRMDYANLLAPPGRQYLLGTDNYGRDILSRIIWGARLSLYVGLLSVGTGTTGGAILGLISGFVGGKTDAVIQRFIDTLMAFPMLILALTIVAALGSSMNNVIVAVAIVLIPQGCRVVRSSALSVRETQYVEAARSIGASTLRLLFYHILPNCTAPYIIVATAALGWAIVVEASLSFLGMGTPPPEPSWGAMLSGEGMRFLEKAPWNAIFPGIAISLAVFGFNLLGDTLRDIWDPRLRGR